MKQNGQLQLCSNQSFGGLAGLQFEFSNGDKTTWFEQDSREVRDVSDFKSIPVDETQIISKISINFGSNSILGLRLIDTSGTPFVDI